MAGIYYDIGEKVKIVEGEFKGEEGVIVDECRSSFGKQFLDVCLTGVTVTDYPSFNGVATRRDTHDPIVRKRAADVRRP